MLGGLVFLALPLAAFVFWSRSPERGGRVACMHAALAWAAGVAALTEGVSLFGALRFWPVLLAWLTVDVALALMVWRAWAARPPWPRPECGTVFVCVVAGALGLLLALALAAAMFAPPNTADVLSYHLPRQLMWLQQGSVRHFVTADDRALMMPPLAEMIQAHAMLLSGGDWWANLPQWLAYALGTGVTSLLALELGASRRGQWLAALVFATLPMAYLEASSAKNDLLVAVWLAMLAWSALRIARSERAPTAEWLAAGAALGLALATKTTAFVFGAPVLVVLVPAARRHVRGALLLTAVVLLLAGPHWARNFAWYGTPLGIHRAEDGGAQANESFTWRAVVSNVARDATLHLATPSTAANHALATAVARLHRWIDQDLNDPRTTLWVLHYDVVWEPQDEPVAGAPVQAVLGAGVILWLLIRGPRRGPPGAALGIAAAGLVLYCVVLKWQPWGARLQLPAFVVLAALIAWAADRLGARVAAVVAGVCVAGWLPSAEVISRPLWTSPTVLATSRWENYFNGYATDRIPSEACVRVIEASGAGSVQVITRHGFPYPLLRRLLDETGSRVQLWGTLPDALTSAPEAVVLMEPFERSWPLYITLATCKERYRAAGATDPWAVYLPESRARALAPQLPLPRFIGWNHVEGLDPMLEFLPRHDGMVPARRPIAPEVKFFIRETSPHMSVRLEAANAGATSCALELRFDGRRMASVSFAPGQEVQAVEVPFAPEHATGELSLVAASGEAMQALVFYSIQIDER